jgi:hypothetical protein
MEFIKGEIAQQRMKIIKFYEKYGEKTTLEIFGVNRKTVNRWRKRLKENNGKVVALLPLPKRPKRVRKSVIPAEITEFIKTIRLRYPRIGKEKIKPILDKYCSENGIKSISESTIGNIIKRHNFFFHRSINQNISSGNRLSKDNKNIKVQIEK